MVFGVARAGAQRGHAAIALPRRKKNEWQPQNGFDGMATVGGLVMICYALVLLVAAGFNVGAKKVRHTLARATVNRRSCAAKVPAQKVGRITMYDVRLTQAQDRATRASSVVIDRS